MIERRLTEQARKNNPDIKIVRSIRRGIVVLDNLPGLSAEEKRQVIASYVWTLNPSFAKKGSESFSLPPEFIQESVEATGESSRLSKALEIVEYFNSNPDKFQDVLQKLERQKEEKKNQEMLELDENLKTLYWQGKPMSEIAVELGFSRGKIKNRITKLIKMEELDPRPVVRVKRTQRLDVYKPNLYEVYANEVQDMRNRGFNNRQIKDSIQASSGSVSRIIHRLKEKGSLQVTFQTHLKEKIEKMFASAKEKGQTISNKEISVVLSEHYGREITLISIQRAVSKLIRENKVRARRSQREAAKLDLRVLDLLKEGKGPAEISRELNIGKSRAMASISRIQHNGLVEKKKHMPRIKEQLEQLLKDRAGQLKEGEKVNLSKIAKELKVSRERIRQLYNELKNKGANLPPKQDRTKSSTDK